MNDPNPKSAIRNLKSLLSTWQTAVAGSDHLQPPAYTGPDVPLTQLTDDTRRLQPGGCFVARVRRRGDGSVWSDGHRYVPQAIEKEAAVIVAEQPAEGLDVSVPDDVIYLTTPDTAAALAWLAAAWHDFPSHQLLVIGITGTDGKSSTAQILLTLLRAAGLRAGMLSTIKAVIGDAEEPLPLHVTTPEAPLIQRYLRRMVDAGLTHAVLETTSHALAQGRVAAVAYDVAAVTNITHEHLDYHGSLQAYFAAKQRLFEIVGTRSWQVTTDNEHKRAVRRTAVLNRDDNSFSRLSRISVPRQISYGLGETAEVAATDVAYKPGGTTFTLSLPQAEALPVSTPLLGEFNVYNMLAAAAVGMALDLSPDAIRRGLASGEAISGRMEPIDRGQSFQVIVDFAHSPISLEKAIALGRRMLDEGGRLITVFGSAGERDVAKRSLMAAVSARDADLTVLTAEDPRSESLTAILGVMGQACREEGNIEGETFWRIPDRGRAIYHALTLAEPSDLVLICGKGHEQSMCFGETEYPWDDREVTRAALDAFLAGRPMVDLGLPTFAIRNTS